MALRHQGKPPATDETITVQPSAASPGLLLRPWTEHDIPAMVAAHRDPVMRTWLRHPVTTAEEARTRATNRITSACVQAGENFCRAAMTNAAYTSSAVPPAAPAAAASRLSVPAISCSPDR
jgi:hypothetical protein